MLEVNKLHNTKINIKKFIINRPLFLSDLPVLVLKYSLT